METALQEPGARLAFTTDSFVVTRWSFPAATSAHWLSAAP